MKNRRPTNLVNRYRYFIAGVLAVVLGYGVFVLLKRAVPQRESELPSVQKISFERFVLTNGLEVIVHRDPSSPTVSINVSYRVGSRDEPRGKAGLAHLAEHVMLAGAAHEHAGPNPQVERLGALDYNGATDRDRTRLFMTVPKQALDAALRFESERMGHLAESLSGEEVALARRDVLEQLRQTQSGSASAFETALTGAMFPPSHPYSHLPGGTPEEIASISLQDVRQWLKEHYRPDNATLVLAGDLEPQTVRSRVETYFGPIFGGPRRQPLMTALPRQELTRHYVTPLIRPGTVVLAWALPGYGSPELDFLDLARHILERRLTRRLVLEGGAAGSIQINLKPYQLCSLLVLKVAPSAGGSEPKIISEIEGELASLTSAGVTSQELTEAKRAILASLSFMSERVGGLTGKAEILASGAIFTGDAAEFNTTVDRVREASTEDVATPVKTWLSFRTATLITSGEKAGEIMAPTSADERPQARPPVGKFDRRMPIVPMGPRWRSEHINCQQVSDVSRQLSYNSKQIWLVLGDAERLADKIRQPGH